MLDKNHIGAQTVLPMEKTTSLKNYSDAKDFYTAKPLLLANAAAPAPTTDSFASDQGMVQFHLIGQKTDDPKYSDIMNENQDNLLGIGGLVHDYMHTHFPTVTAQKLDITTWSNVIANIPDLAIGSATSKSYSNSIKGVSISGDFLTLIAKALITEGSSLLTDFSSYLTSMGDIVFSKKVTSESYKALTCTYQSYLLDNGAGGYYDYGAIVLRQIEFAEHFMELKAACVDAKSVQIAMNYTEIVNLVQTRRIRKGGVDYDNFQGLVNANSTAQFKKAKNFFNGGSTPQADIKPQV